MWLDVIVFAKAFVAFSGLRASHFKVLPTEGTLNTSNSSEPFQILYSNNEGINVHSFSEGETKEDMHI